MLYPNNLWEPAYPDSNRPWSGGKKNIEVI